MGKIFLGWIFHFGFTNLHNEFWYVLLQLSFCGVILRSDLKTITTLRYSYIYIIHIALKLLCFFLWYCLSHLGLLASVLCRIMIAIILYNQLCSILFYIWKFEPNTVCVVIYIYCLIHMYKLYNLPWSIKLTLTYARTNFKQNMMITKSKPSQWLGAAPPRCSHLLPGSYWNWSLKNSPYAPEKKT